MFMLFPTFLLVVHASDKAATFRGLPDQAITGQEVMVMARCTVECAIHCKRHLFCDSFAFDKITGMCYLHPIISSGNESNFLRVYKDSNPVCQTGTFIMPKGNIIEQRTLDSMTASVICDPDYVFTHASTSLTCLSDGQWMAPDAQCAQRIWRNPAPGKFPIPRNVTTGWSMCFQGVPTGNRTQVDIVGDTSTNMIVSVNWYLNSRNVKAVDRKNGTWSSPEISTAPFPLSVGQNFSMTLNASSPTTVQVFCNGVQFFNRTIQFNLSDFYYVSITYNVSISMVDTWCQ